MIQNQKLLIEPELYQKTLERLSLISICLDEVKACCSREVAQEGLVDISLSIEAKDQQTEGHYYAFITYSLKGQRGSEVLLEVEAKYRLIFDTPEFVPKGFFEIYSDPNLRITTMPYFRELVTSLTGRMEIPTLTLPYAIFAAPKEEVEEEPSVILSDEITKKRTRKSQTAKV